MIIIHQMKDLEKVCLVMVVVKSISEKIGPISRVYFTLCR